MSWRDPLPGKSFIPRGSGRFNSSARAGYNPGWTRQGDFAGHKGDDAYANRGTPVLSAHDDPAQCHRAGWLGIAAGNSVELVRREGSIWWASRYLHLEGLQVQRGQIVQPGQMVGRIGAARPPWVNAPHTHFEIRRLTSYNPSLSMFSQGVPWDPSLPPLSVWTTIPDTGGDDLFVKQGDKGPVVEFWQRYLVGRGADLAFPGGPPQGIDGSYGPKTAAAVKAIIGGDGTSIGPEQAVAVLAGLADPVDFETVEVLRRVKR